MNENVFPNDETLEFRINFLNVYLEKLDADILALTKRKDRANQEKKIYEDTLNFKRANKQ